MGDYYKNEVYELLKQYKAWRKKEKKSSSKLWTHRMIYLGAILVVLLVIVFLMYWLQHTNHYWLLLIAILCFLLIYKPVALLADRYIQKKDCETGLTATAKAQLQNYYHGFYELLFRHNICKFQNALNINKLILLKDVVEHQKPGFRMPGLIKASFINIAIPFALGVIVSYIVTNYSGYEVYFIWLLGIIESVVIFVSVVIDILWGWYTETYTHMVDDLNHIILNML